MNGFAVTAPASLEAKADTRKILPYLHLLKILPIINKKQGNQPQCKWKGTDLTGSSLQRFPLFFFFGGRGGKGVGIGRNKILD